MKLGMAGGARSEYYDRTPDTQHQVYSAAGVAPHASTQRASLTVAAGEADFIQMIQLSAIRDTANGGAAGLMMMNAALTPNGGALGIILSAHNLSTAAGSVVNVVSDIGLPMQEGDVIAIYSVDSSAGGTYRYGVALTHTDFDA